MSLLPNMDLYLPLAGFLFSLVLLLYSLASYREALASPAVQDAEDAADGEDAQELDEISAEIGSFKEKIRQMQEMVSMRKTLHEKQISEIIGGINGIVGRLEKADPEKVAALQPHIAKLVGELQDLRAPHNQAQKPQP